MKKILIIIISFNLCFNHVFSTEPPRRLTTFTTIRLKRRLFRCVFAACIWLGVARPPSHPTTLTHWTLLRWRARMKASLPKSLKSAVTGRQYPSGLHLPYSRRVRGNGFQSGRRVQAPNIFREFHPKYSIFHFSCS